MLFRSRDVRDRFARNLEDLNDELDGPAWDRVFTSRKNRAKSPDEDLSTVLGEIRRSSNDYSSNGRPSKRSESVIDEMCKRYGVPVESPQDMGAPSTIGSGSVELMNLAAIEEGIVGTPIRTGRPRKEPTGKYEAMTVRGSAGNSGLYETYWASEAQIYDAVQGHIDSLVSGKWVLQMPKRVAPGQRGAMREFIDYHNSKLLSVQCMMGSWPTFIQHAATIIPFGFSVFEPIFAQDTKNRNRWYWQKAGFREQATVDKWISSEKGDRITGIEFKTGGDDARLYTLLAAEDFRANHVLWFGLNAFGSNWEGRPPTRPALHWVKMKRLIAQIVPLAAEKYGVPISYIRSDPAYLLALANGAALNEPDLSDAYDKFKDARAAEGPVFKFADGIIAETIAPPGTMPGLDAWIAYCDQMISFPFSNEGNLLGMQSAVGSYAQAEVKERRFLRSAPGYARWILEPLNCRIVAPLARAELDDLIEPPLLVYRSDVLADVGSWLDNSRKLFPNLTLEEWPDEYQDIAHEKMGVSLEDPPGEELVGGEPETAPTTEMVEYQSAESPGGGHIHAVEGGFTGASPEGPDHVHTTPTGDQTGPPKGANGEGHFHELPDGSSTGFDLQLSLPFPELPI